jgi:hypothetical protein
MDTSQNSLTLYLCAYVEAMFDDIADTYTRPYEWKRDKTRLLHEIRQHGSQVLTITLPAVGKSLDQALDKGLYRPTRSYLSKSKAGEKVPVFLRDLFIQIFDPSDGVLRDDPNLAAVADLRQLLLGGKKLLLSCSTRRIYDEVKDFVRTEASNRHPTLDWISDDLVPDSNVGKSLNSLHFKDLWREGRDDAQPQLFEPDWYEPSSVPGRLETLQHICDKAFFELGDFSQENGSKPRHGPGAVANKEVRMSKYDFRDWPSKLECVYPPDAYATHDFMCGKELGDPGQWRNREVASRLITVPKTQKAPRLIAAEPSQYQWIQQLLKQQVERAVGKSPILNNSIDFRSQEKNQQAAVIGSKGGGNVTIDLSSASDRLTCWVVERAVRSNVDLLCRLHASRTRWVRNQVDRRLEEFLLLKKFATQGSAVIFPYSR